jgi:hypothetical protein
MGLDTHASRGRDTWLTPDDVEAFRTARVLLCECDGDTSFRGKIYTSVVGSISGVFLAEGWTPPETVLRMAAAMETCDPVGACRDESRVSPGEVVELGRFLRVCADRGLGLVGD